MARRLAAIAVALLLAAAGGCSGPTAPDTGPRLEPGDTPSDTARALVDVTNAERARAGLPSLRMQTQLMQAAQLQAEQVAATGRIEHTLAEARYPTLEDRLAAAGYRWRLAGENLAFGQRSAAAAVETWLTSSSHRANIFNERFTEIGTGFLVDRNGRPYYVQVFGLPAS